MKQAIILATFLLCSVFSSKAQITLAHSFGPTFAEAEIVNLSLSGKKIMVISPAAHDSTSSIYTDTINFYNLDFSFWKKIVCPYVPGWIMDGYVYYPSETLFNTDPLLEVAVAYGYSSSAAGKFYIINENNVIVDSIPNVYINGGGSVFNLYDNYMRVYEVDTLGIGFQAVVTTPTGVAIYNLPGTLPCNTCSGNGLCVAKNEHPNNGIQTQPIPNPSSEQVKITFTLPQGANQGNLVLYNTEGQKIKSFVVDNHFGYIMLDNSKLASGVYYYNIEVNGEISSTQKLVVIK